MVSTKHHPHGHKDDDTTISSNSNNSSIEGSSNNSSNESGNSGTGPVLGQASRRNKNRNKKRKEQKQQLKQAIQEEGQLIADSSRSATGVRLAVLIILFFIGALLGVTVIPILKKAHSKFQKDARITTKNLVKDFAAVKEPSKFATGALSDASKAGKHLVEILSSTTITVYGEHEETYTNGHSGTKLTSAPSYHFSSSSCLDSSCSGAGATAPTIRAHHPSPVLCSDGYTRGYDDWNALRSAIHNLNNDQNGWNKLHDGGRVNHNNVVDNLYSDSLEGGGGPIYIVYVDTYEPFTICPGATLRARNFRGGGIYVNRQDVIIECDGCTLDMGGTHFRFGSEAKGVTIRGLSLMGASTSSLLFHEDGAEVTFEDCTWINNSGLMDDGAVADLNSTSSVSFYRCEISDSKQRPLRFGNSNAFVGSSLIIRNL